MACQNIAGADRLCRLPFDSSVIKIWPPTRRSASLYAYARLKERSFDNASMPARPTHRYRNVAFIDVETTGLDPERDKIAEVGVILSGGGGLTQWSRLLLPGKARGMVAIGGEQDLSNAPTFPEIARELHELLRGRLLIAHNARFDYGFLRAEFERAGWDFRSEVLCSLRLSRALYPLEPAHDLDSIMARYQLRANIRHRAVPDASLVAQYWEHLVRTHSHSVLFRIADNLVAGPLLPEQLDPSLLNGVPQKAGVLELHGDSGLLYSAAAANLRVHLQNYFRIDLASSKALSVATRVRVVRWHRTAGVIGARLLDLSRIRDGASRQEQAQRAPVFALQFDPGQVPSVRVVEAFAGDVSCGSLYGLYSSQRKASNAIQKLWDARALCGSLVDPDVTRCARCQQQSGCTATANRAHRAQVLLEVFAALRPLRVYAWPFGGPIAIRERTDLHVLDQWCYLGSARCITDARELPNTRRPSFDRGMYAYLVRLLPNVTSRNITTFAERTPSSACVLAEKE